MLFTADDRDLYLMFLEEYHPDKWKCVFATGDMPEVTLDQICQTITATIQERWPKKNAASANSAASSCEDGNPN